MQQFLRATKTQIVNDDNDPSRIFVVRMGRHRVLLFRLGRVFLI